MTALLLIAALINLWLVVSWILGRGAHGDTLIEQ